MLSGDRKRLAFATAGAWAMGVAQRFSVEQIGVVTVARFIDSRIVDELAIREIDEQLEELASERDYCPLVLNFENVEFLSSSLLNSLIRMNAMIEASLGKLILCNLRPNIRKVFDITRLSTRFDIRENEAKALAAFEYEAELSSV
jgi:anti-sigma B factor antagonist